MASTQMASPTELDDFRVDLGGLQQLTAAGADIEPEDTPSIPPADGGKAAWLFLAGSFCIEMLLWGTRTVLR